MDKYTIITISAIIVIAIPFAISTMNIIGSEQVQYRWNAPGSFSFFKMSTNGSLEFCNTLPFWTSIDKFDIIMHYQGEELGTYSVGPITMDPLKPSNHKGTFTSEHVARAHTIFMTIDYGVASGEVRIDPRNFVIQTQMSTPILGLIPYNTHEQISGLDFDQRMRADDLYCN